MSTQGRPTSSVVLSSTSMMTGLPPASPLISSQSRPENTNRRVVSTESTFSGSGIPNSDPVIISNRDILTMFTQVKEQLGRVERSNEILRKDMENLRTRADIPITQVTIPIRSRILDSDTSPSSGYRGNFIAVQGSTGITDPVNAIGIPTTRDHRRNPGSSSRIPNDGNIFTNYSADNTFGTNILQDPGVSHVMERELQNLKDMISNIPRVVQPIPEIAPTAHRIPRFASPICGVEIPKGFQNPGMKLYDGTTDPEEHIAKHRERMEIIPIPADLKEAYLCKSFGSTLTGSVLKWLLDVPPYFITSFAHMVNLFDNQFSCNRTFESLTNDLYRVVQKSNETLRVFVSRFGRESLRIPNLDMSTAVHAFKMGVKRDSPFYEDLVINPCRNLDEVRNRALRFIKLEEGAVIQKRIETSSTYEKPNRKMNSSPFKSNKIKPYSRNVDHRANVVKEDGEEYSKLTDYCFYADATGILYAMQKLGDKVRWPKKKVRDVAWKDKFKWCAFHEDFGHVTENCVALRNEINHLLSEGYLRELFGKKGSHKGFLGGSGSRSSR